MGDNQQRKTLTPALSLPGRGGQRGWIVLLCLALVVRLLVALSLTGPAYMDAYYYTAGAWRLAEGRGWPLILLMEEPFLWHYLDDPNDVPHPGFLYWMPLPSILAALPTVLLEPLLGRSFLVAQLPFVLLSALLPLVSYSVAWRTMGERRSAWVAGLLTLFSGLYFPYWTLPESFAPFALFGSLALWVAGSIKPGAGRVAPFVSGVLVGLAHLTRADGILLLPVVALAPLISLRWRGERKNGDAGGQRRGIGNWDLEFVICSWSLIVMGYLLVMGPWFLRNLSVIGAPLSPAGAKTLWLTDYDDLFCYGCDLSLRSYLAWGWGNIVRSKLFALWSNFQHLLAEGCLVFLLPFASIGLYRLRRCPPFALALIYLFALYLAHSLVFTLPGWRGGFFHSGGALLPFLHAAGVEGLDVAVKWAARRRRWNLRQARGVFFTAAVVAAVALSAYTVAEKWPSWRGAGAVYREIDAWLDARGVPDDARIMVGNPPGFWYHTQRLAVVVPNEDLSGLLKVVERYRVEYLLLDRNHPEPLSAFYAGEESVAQLEAVATWEGEDGRTVLYAVRR